jgi:hypothetical protein
MLLQSLVYSVIITIVTINYITLKFAFLFEKRMKKITYLFPGLVSLDFSDRKLYFYIDYPTSTQFHRDPMCINPRPLAVFIFLFAFLYIFTHYHN